QDLHLRLGLMRPAWSYSTTPRYDFANLKDAFINYIIYIIMFVFTAMGSTGRLNTLLSAWIPNILVFTIASSRLTFLMK
ncbi:MAG: hypothetical protein ACK4IX_10085, partial [Candidatus Sericytochromatia bacterium]